MVRSRCRPKREPASVPTSVPREGHQFPYRRAASESSQKDPSQWYVAVFFLGVGVALVFEDAERGDDEAASVGGLDDAVEVAAFGGDERVGETVAEFGDFFLAKFRAFARRGGVEFAFVDNVHGAFGAHDGD